MIIENVIITNSRQIFHIVTFVLNSNKFIIHQPFLFFSDNMSKLNPTNSTLIRLEVQFKDFGSRSWDDYCNLYYKFLNGGLAKRTFDQFMEANFLNIVAYDGASPIGFKTVDISSKPQLAETYVDPAHSTLKVNTDSESRIIMSQNESSKYNTSQLLTKAAYVLLRRSGNNDISSIVNSEPNSHLRNWLKDKPLLWRNEVKSSNEPSEVISGLQEYFKSD